MACVVEIHRPAYRRSRAVGQEGGILEDLGVRSNVMAAQGGEILEEIVAYGQGRIGPILVTYVVEGFRMRIF